MAANNTRTNLADRLKTAWIASSEKVKTYSNQVKEAVTLKTAQERSALHAEKYREHWNSLKALSVAALSKLYKERFPKRQSKWHKRLHLVVDITRMYSHHAYHVALYFSSSALNQSVIYTHKVIETLSSRKSMQSAVMTSLNAFRDWARGKAKKAAPVSASSPESSESLKASTTAYGLVEDFPANGLNMPGPTEPMIRRLQEAASGCPDAPAKSVVTQGPFLKTTLDGSIPSFGVTKGSTSSAPSCASQAATPSARAPMLFRRNSQKIQNFESIKSLQDAVQAAIESGSIKDLQTLNLLTNNSTLWVSFKDTLLPCGFSPLGLACNQQPTKQASEVVNYLIDVAGCDVHAPGRTRSWKVSTSAHTLMRIAVEAYNNMNPDRSQVEPKAIVQKLRDAGAIMDKKTEESYNPNSLKKNPVRTSSERLYKRLPI